MKKKTLLTNTVLLALMLTAGTAIADEKGVMEKLAALEGEWILLDENGEETDVIGSTFRMTSAGSALVEVMFPGSPDGHEMLNMYHADGDRVLMTHYCAAGNQPRLEVKATDDEDRLELHFESITNLASPEEDHMHQAEYIFHGDDRLTTHWQSKTNGKLSEGDKATFELKRKK